MDDVKERMLEEVKNITPEIELISTTIRLAESSGIILSEMPEYNFNVLVSVTDI